MLCQYTPILSSINIGEDSIAIYSFLVKTKSKGPKIQFHLFPSLWFMPYNLSPSDLQRRSACAIYRFHYLFFPQAFEAESREIVKVKGGLTDAAVILSDFHCFSR